MDLTMFWKSGPASLLSIVLYNNLQISSCYQVRHCIVVFSCVKRPQFGKITQRLVLDLQETAEGLEIPSKPDCKVQSLSCSMTMF